MKKLLLTAVLSLILALVGASPLAHADYVNQSDIDAAETALNAVNAFSDGIQSDSTTAAELATDGQTAQQALDTFSAHQFSTNLGDDYTQASDTLKQNGQLLKADIGTLVSDVNAQNRTAADTDLVTYNGDIGSFNTALQSMNAAVDSTNKTIAKKNTTFNILYVLLFIASLGLMGWTIIWSRKHIKANPGLAHARKRLIIMTIFPVAGAAITMITFFVASRNGGTYYIAYGPIAFGLLAYARGIVSYRAAIGNLAPVAPGYNPANPMMQPMQSMQPVSPIPQAPAPVTAFAPPAPSPMPLAQTPVTMFAPTPPQPPAPMPTPIPDTSMQQPIPQFVTPQPLMQPAPNPVFAPQPQPVNPPSPQMPPQPPIQPPTVTQG